MLIIQVFFQEYLELTHLIYLKLIIFLICLLASTSHIREEDNSRVPISYIREEKRVDNIKIENHLDTPDMDPM